jgi:hypothetical protein
MQRTLRKDVLEYVPYTDRHALTVPFKRMMSKAYMIQSVSICSEKSAMHFHNNKNI